MKLQHLHTRHCPFVFRADAAGKCPGPVLAYRMVFSVWFRSRRSPGRMVTGVQDDAKAIGKAQVLLPMTQVSTSTYVTDILNCDLQPGDRSQDQGREHCGRSLGQRWGYLHKRGKGRTPAKQGSIHGVPERRPVHRFSKYAPIRSPQGLAGIRGILAKRPPRTRKSRMKSSVDPPNFPRDYEMQLTHQVENKAFISC